MIDRGVHFAQRMLMEYWDKESIPIIPEKIIDALRNSMDKPDIFVKFEPLDHSETGRITYNNTCGTYVITINNNHPAKTQRFALSHQLGHYALSHGVVTGCDNRFDIRQNQKEIEADAFAIELLMPKAIIKYLVFQQKIFELQELSRLLWVSEEMMMYRLKTMGFLR